MLLHPLAVLAAAMAPAVLAAAPAPAALAPAALAPPEGAGLEVVLVARGFGNQVYTCSLDQARPPGFEWQLRMPDADLVDPASAAGRPRKVGRLFAGMVFQHADGSKVKARVKAKADAPQAGALGWVLFDATSLGTPGVLAAITAIQQVATEGGGQPQHTCDVDSLGKQARVPFVAEYRFWAPRRR